MYKIKQTPEDFIVKEISNINIGKKGRYTYFILKKRNYTTEKAVQTIANYLHIPRKRFGYAGSKDKIAVSEQTCSVLGNIRNLKLKEILVNVIGRGDKPVSLGDLEGNNFKIIVRAATKKPKKIKNMVNYFDEQRFSTNNIEIGKDIIKKNFKEAVKIIINNDVIGNKIKNYLKNKPNDYIGALRLIPKKTLMLYVNSYQSFIWNETAKHFEMNKNNIKIPIVGFDTEFKDGKVKKVVENIIKKEDINLRDFIIREMPELSSAGGERDLFVDIKNLKVKKINNNNYEITFFLPKASYATMAIKNMFGKI